MMPVGESADAVGRKHNFGRGLPVSSAMYRMNAVPKPPPAMSILRVAGAGIVAAARRTADRLAIVPIEPATVREMNARRFTARS
jgi:hypothetical protein